jgi:hypothetical protein
VSLTRPPAPPCSYDFVPATGKWVRNATGALQFEPGVASQLLTSRYEGGAWVMYALAATRVHRFVPSTGARSVLAGPPPVNSTYYGVAVAPVNAGMIAASASATPSTTATASQTGSASGTPSNSPSPSTTGTPAPSAGVSPSSTMTPSVTPRYACWRPEHVLALRGDSTGVPAGGAAPLTLVAYDPAAPDAGVVAQLALPTLTSVDPVTGATHYRCVTRGGSASSESNPTRSLDGSFIVIPCYDADPGANAMVLNAAGTRRVFALVGADCRVDTTTSCADCFGGSAAIRGATAISRASGILAVSNVAANEVRYVAVGGSTSRAATSTFGFGRWMGWVDLGGGRGPELSYTNGAGSTPGPLVFPLSVSGGLNLSAPGEPLPLPGTTDAASTATTPWWVAVDTAARQMYLSDSARVAGGSIDR